MSQNESANGGAQKSPQNNPGTTPQSKKNGAGTKFFIALGIIVVAVLGFAVAEKLGLTGTHFIVRDEAPVEETTPAKKPKKTAETPDAAAKKTAEDVADDDASKGKKKSKKSKKASSEKSSKKASSEKKSAKKDDFATRSEPFPREAFSYIAPRDYTWPRTVRLTRTRSISITDPQSGISLGKMEVPAGTVVSVVKVYADGRLDVRDSTRQIFSIEASSTNFADAYLAYKAEKQEAHKKAVAKKKAKAAKAKKEKASVASSKKAKKSESSASASAAASAKQSSSSGSSPRMTAFGIAWDDDDDDWGDDDDE